MFRPEDIDAFNKDVSGWTKDTYKNVLDALDSLGIKHYEYSKSPVPLRQAIKTSIRKTGGVASRISFKIPRHAVFVHKGVGRGAKAGSPSNRKAKQFLNPPIEKNLSKLVETVADHQGTMIVNALIIK